MIIPIAAVSFMTRRVMQRECPVCGHLQTVQLARLGETVTCERCDYRIPPRKSAA